MDEITIYPEHVPQLPSAPPPKAANELAIRATPFDDKAQRVFERSANPDDVDIRPDGMVYIPHTVYRDALNEAFGRGGWQHLTVSLNKTPIMDRKTGEQKGEDIHVVGRLLVAGQIVADGTGTASYHFTNRAMNYSDAIESAKSVALRRCCKDFLFPELWDRRWAEDWKARYAERWTAEREFPRRVDTIWKRRDKPEVPGYKLLARLKSDAPAPDAPEASRAPESGTDAARETRRTIWRLIATSHGLSGNDVAGVVKACRPITGYDDPRTIPLPDLDRCLAAAKEYHAAWEASQKGDVNNDNA